MGFMAGFGPTFASSFNASRQRAHEMKQDAFRLTYQDYMQRQQQYDEWNREDAKYVKTAQDYEQMYNLPEGSWTQIYSWVKSGHDADQIQEWVQKGQWTVDETTPQPDKSAQVTGIDAEMQGSGMLSSEAPSNQPVQSEQRDTGLFGNLLGNLAQKGKKKTQNSFERRRAGAIEQVAAQSGRTVEEIQDVMDGYKPPALPQSNVTFTAPTPEAEKDPFTDGNAAYIEQAQAHDAAKRSPTPRNLERARQADIRVKALQDRAFMEAEIDALSKGVSQNGSQVTLWEDGKYVGSGRLMKTPDGQSGIMVPGKGIEPLGNRVSLLMTDEELSLRKEVNSQLDKERETIDTQRQNAHAAFSTINSMNETIRNTRGEVLKPITAGITSKVEQWAIDFATGAEKLSQAFADPKNQGKEVMNPKMFEQAIAAEKALLAADKTDLGAQKLLYDTQKAILAYRIGMAMGQEGRGLAEAERKLFTEIATSGVTVDQFYNNMSGLMMPIVKSIDQSGTTAYKRAADKFKGQYQYVPGEMEYTPLTTELSNNPETKPLFEEFMKRDRSGPATIISTKDPETGVKDVDLQGTPSGPPVGTVKMFGGQKYIFKGGNPNDKNNWKAQ